MTRHDTIGQKYKPWTKKGTSAVETTLTFEVVKAHKRLHIAIKETGERVYTPPDFLKLPNREVLRVLARAFTEAQSRDIGLIVEFESRWRRR